MSSVDLIGPKKRLRDLKDAQRIRARANVDRRPDPPALVAKPA
jgi:hypothetical protein